MTPRDERLPRTRRILRAGDFARVYRFRQSAADGPLVLYAAPREILANGPSDSRIGLSVSRRIGNAVVRNRWKRRLREAFRVARSHAPAGHDYVIVVRSGLPPEGAEGARQIEAAIVQLAVQVTSRPRYGRPSRSGDGVDRVPRGRGRST